MSATFTAAFGTDTPGVHIEVKVVVTATFHVEEKAREAAEQFAEKVGLDYLYVARDEPD
jgi:hypothetical protein